MYIYIYVCVEYMTYVYIYIYTWVERMRHTCSDEDGDLPDISHFEG